VTGQPLTTRVGNKASITEFQLWRLPKAQRLYTPNPSWHCRDLRSSCQKVKLLYRCGNFYSWLFTSSSFIQRELDIIRAEKKAILNWFLEHDNEFTLMASKVTRYQSNRALLVCGRMVDLHHGCAADKSAATAWCSHDNMDQYLWWMFPAPNCWIYAMKN